MNATPVRPGLAITLEVVPEGVRVTWRLSGVAVPAGGRVGVLPSRIAGAPTIDVESAGLSASDDRGAIPLELATIDDAEDVPEHVWSAGRDTAGVVVLSHLARPTEAEPLPATAPLELRREAGGLIGALKCFLVLPSEPADLAFELRWVGPAEVPGDWRAVTSLGECSGPDDVIAGEGLERLGDTYVICGDLTERHHRDGELSTWWLTPPGFDVLRFSDRLATTYDLLSTTFAQPAHPYRVFLRAHPHRGANGSGHPASFVMAMNPGHPLAESSLYEMLAHELVHEWLHLDGSDLDVRWFVEGSADYYSLVLPARAGLATEEAFLDAVNAEARSGYANPRRHLAMADATPLFFDDFYAHWLPYVRGMFYLADLGGRIDRATDGARSVDDVVREVTRLRMDGERIGVGEWCEVVDRTLADDERAVLDAMVFTGTGRPGPDTFGPRFEGFEAEVPLLDGIGFDVTTFLTSRVEGLVPGGPAELAGLREGDVVELPGYHQALALGPEDDLVVGVLRDGTASQVTVPLAGRTVAVPQWRRAEGP